MAGSLGCGLADSKSAVGHDSEYRVFQTCGLYIFLQMERVASMEEPEGWRELQQKALGDLCALPATSPSQL